VLGRGIVSVGSRICQGLGWLADGTVTPMNVEVEIDGVRFNVGDELRRDPSDACDGGSRADSPEWSLDGEWIAFLASARGELGIDGLSSPWSLILMRPDGTDRQAVLADLEFPLGVAIDASGGRVAISATRHAMEGTWIVDRETGASALVCACLAQGLAFSPRADQLALSETVTPFQESTAVVIFDLIDDDP
jgi:hypothetical protein